MALIEKIEFCLNLLENSDAIVQNPNFRRCGGFLDVNADLAGVGMINDIIEHLGKAVTPNVENVCRHLIEQRQNIVAPDHVLFETRNVGVHLNVLRLRAEMVSLLASFSFAHQHLFIHEILKVLVYRLP